MKIQTLNLIAGDKSCNAHCPFCISKMTGHEKSVKKEPINIRNLRKACTLADRSGTDTVLITGKGEPTLSPNDIYNYLDFLEDHYNFSFIELQTNGLNLHTKTMQKHLEHWFQAGLNTISISTVHFKKEKNQKIYTGNKEYISLPETVSMLKSIGYLVRISCVLMRGYIDNTSLVRSFIHWCKEMGVDQVSFAPIGVSNKETSTDKEVERAKSWAFSHRLYDYEVEKIIQFMNTYGIPIMKLQHGATIYDLYDISVCMRDCLTEPRSENIRQLIFYPSGKLMYSWEYKGARLL